MDEKKIYEERNWRTDNAAQDQSLRRRWLKYYIDRATDSRKPRMCGKMDENDF